MVCSFKEFEEEVLANLALNFFWDVRTVLLDPTNGSNVLTECGLKGRHILRACHREIQFAPPHFAFR